MPSSRWQSLPDTQRSTIVTSVIEQVNATPLFMYGPRRVGGRTGMCELMSLALGKAFTAPEIQLNFSVYDSGHLEEVFGLSWGTLSGYTGHTFGVLENSLLFDLTIENRYSEGENIPPIVHQLMEVGYVNLTDTNLHAYAEALAKRPLALSPGREEKLLDTSPAWRGNPVI